MKCISNYDLNQKEILVYDSYDLQKNHNLMESKLDKSIQNFHCLKIPRPLPVDTPLKILESPKELQLENTSRNINLTKKFTQFQANQYDPYTLVQQINTLDEFSLIREDQFKQLCMIPSNLIVAILRQRKQMQETVLHQRRQIIKYSKQ